MGIKSSHIRIGSTFYGSPLFSRDSIRNHLFYASKWGYDYEPKVGNIPFRRHHSWAKPFLALEAFDVGFDYFFWMDGDSWFLNSEKSLESFVELNRDFVFTGDHNDIFNGGHFLVRNTLWTREFLQDWCRIHYLPKTQLATTHRQGDYLDDQPAMIALLAGADPNDSRTWEESFNRVNGFPGNPNRRLRDFSSGYAPISVEGALNAMTLIAPHYRDFCWIVPQREMNSYPDDFSLEDLCIHFVGGTKGFMQQLAPYICFDLP